jgi:hypothetical protein
LLFERLRKGPTETGESGGATCIERHEDASRLAPLLVTLITLTRFSHSLGPSLYILGQGPTLIVGFAEPAFVIAAYVAFITSGIYQLALAAHLLACHKNPPCSV